MGDWTSYRLADFLLFSERTYRRLHEAQVEAWWPLPLVALALGTALLLAHVLVPRTRGLRLVGLLLLAAAWTFVAITFLHTRYAPINPLAGWGAWAFGAQAAMLAVIALRATHAAPQATHAATPSSWQRAGGIALAGAGLLYPAIAALRGTGGAEWFALAPDPTALATLGLAVLMIPKRGWRMAASIVSLGWLSLSALTLSAMNDPVAPWLAVAAGVGLITALWPDRKVA